MKAVRATSSMGAHRHSLGAAAHGHPLDCEELAHILRRAEEVETAAERHEHLRGGTTVPTSWLGRIMLSHDFETFGGFVVLFNFLIMTMETHATAVEDSSVMAFVLIVNRFLLCFYTLECGARIYVMGKLFFFSSWNVLDFVIVTTGLASEFLEVFKLGGSTLEQISMLKSLRMLRLIRLLRLLVAFRELYVLVAGVAKCMKTLFWASGLIFMVLNVWSILSVEYLAPRVNELCEAGEYGSCAWCETAFSNIWLANITWFQIVSGDGWSTLGRPLVEKFWWPYLLFVSNIFMVVWGLLNLIVAAIIDSNLMAREADVASAAKIAAQSQQEAWASFKEMCQEMDTDKNGEISIEEFKNMWSNSEELQQTLMVMGVQEKDMESLLKIMDSDGSGGLDHDEFIEQFTMMKTAVMRTTIYYVLRYVQSIQSHVEAHGSVVKKVLEEFTDFRQKVVGIDDAKVGVNNGCGYEPTTLPTLLDTSVDSTESLAVDSALPGWYYFGECLPMNIVAWSKAQPQDANIIDSPQKHVSPCRLSQKTRDASAKAAKLGADSEPKGQWWEPVPEPVLFVRRASALPVTDVRDSAPSMPLREKSSMVKINGLETFRDSTAIVRPHDIQCLVP